MTYPPTSRFSTMPSQARCDRVPPVHPWDMLESTIAEDNLPLDPRTWRRSDVSAWVVRRGGLPERFPMNGKALCLMTKDMFASRVPDSGHILYRDFRSRLEKALMFQEILERITSKSK